MATSLKNVDDVIKLGHSSWKWEKEQGIMFPEVPQYGYYAINPLTAYGTREPRVTYEMFTEPPQVSLNIGHRSFLLDSRLFHLQDAINESKKLLELKEDWDEDGAMPISPDIYYRAIETLIEYSTNVLNVYNNAIKAPYISAGRDGSIDLDWNTPRADLLITILNTNDFNLHYYGDDGKYNTVIKGIIQKHHVDEDLSHWMRKL